MPAVDYGTGTRDVDTDELERKLRDEAERRNVTYDPSDLQGILRNISYDRGGQSLDDATNAALRRYDERATNNHGGPGGDEPPQRSASTPTQAWSQSGPSSSSSAGNSLFPDWYRGLMEQQITQANAERAEAKSRQDALYGQLSQRASQGLEVSAQDPIIRGQVDAYRAEGQRALRDRLSDAAERQGPYANLSVEQRMGAEKLGQGVGAFQAQLLGRELQSRRDEIVQALSQQGALLSADQQRTLQSQLASLNQAIAQANVGLGARGQDIQQQLGLGDLEYRNRSLSQQQDQFLRELALRQYDLNNTWDYNWIYGRG